MTTKVFVGGLSWGTGDEALLAAFEKFGSVVEAEPKTSELPKTTRLGLRSCRRRTPA